MKALPLILKKAAARTTGLRSARRNSLILLAFVFSGFIPAVYGSPDPTNACDLDCPSNIVVVTDPGTCTAVVNYVVTVIDPGSCSGGVNQDQGLPSGSAFPIGETLNIYSLPDEIACYFTVTVTDNTPPDIYYCGNDPDCDPPEGTCPPDQTVSTDPGECTAVVNWLEPIALDNCGVASFGPDLPSGSLFPLGVTVVTYSASDNAGNLTTCTFQITVEDTEQPEILNCPPSVEVFTDPGQCSAVVSWPAILATDNCGLPTVSPSHNSGDAFPAGFVTGVLIVTTDGAGNNGFCLFSITVLENQPPEISGCPADIVVGTDPGLCEAAVNWTPPTATDNCFIALDEDFISTHNPGDLFPAGITPVTYTATDLDGFSSQCLFTVTVTDTEIPVIADCPTDVVINPNPGTCQAPANWIAPSASDNCTIAGFSSTHDPGDIFSAGITQVTYTATDGAGLTAVCQFNVIVTDNENPTITGCPADIFADTDPGVCQAFVNWTPPVADDNCAIASFVSTHNPGDSFNTGSTLVAYTATDGAGLTAVCQFNVIVTDNEQPEIVNCPKNIAVTPVSGQCLTQVFWLPPTATDNCTSPVLTGDHIPGDLFSLGTTLVTYTAEDEQGNTGACAFTVIVTENQEPVHLTADICEGETYTLGNTTFSAAGQYEIVLTSATGCDSVISLTLTVLPQLFSSRTAELCQGESFFAGGALQTQAGIYLDTLTASAGCDSIVQTELIIHPNPNVQIMGPSTLCIGFSALLSAGAFQHYLWSPGGQITPEVTVTSGGVYGVTVADAYGCTGTDEIAITETLCNTVTAGFTVSQDTACAWHLVQFADQSSPNAVSWFWDFGNGSFSHEKNPYTVYPFPGVYTVRLAAGDGISTDSSEMQIFVYPKIKAGFTAFTPDECHPKSKVFQDHSTGTFGTASWHWNFGDGAYGNGTIAAHTYTNYDTVNVSYAVTDLYGCTDSLNKDVIIVNQGPASPPVHICRALCTGDSLAVGGTVFNSANPTGAVTLTNAAGCDSTVTVELTFIPLESFSLGADKSICENDPVTLNAGPGTGYLWTTGATTREISAAQPGEYQVTVTNDTGCPKVGFIQVGQDQIPGEIPDAGADIQVCETTSIVALNALQPQQATGTWSTPGMAAINNTANPATTVSNLTAGLNTFIWTLSAGACQDYAADTVLVEVIPKATETADAGDDQSFCNTVTDVRLQAGNPVQPGLTGTWTQPGSQADLGIMIEDPANPGTRVSGLSPNNTYLFTWTLTNGACGPVSADNVLVSTYAGQLPPADAGDDINLCSDSEAQLTGNQPAGTLGEWASVGNPSVFIGSPNSAATPVGDLAPGVNAFAWTLSSSDCPAYSSDTVLVFQSQGLQAQPDVYFNLGQPLVNLDFLANDEIPDRKAVVFRFLSTPQYGSLHANAGGTYDFTFGQDTSRNIDFAYEICLRDCPEVCSESNVVILSSSPIPVPAIQKPANVMTPNGDGKGEMLSIPNYTEIPPPIDLTVVNRWGDVVYRIKNYQNDWDGRNQNGKPLPEGTYYFLIKGGGSEVSGPVTILR